MYTWARTWGWLWSKRHTPRFFSRVQRCMQMQCMHSFRHAHVCKYGNASFTINSEWDQIVDTRKDRFFLIQLHCSACTVFDRCWTYLWMDYRTVIQYRSAPAQGRNVASAYTATTSCVFEFVRVWIVDKRNTHDDELCIAISFMFVYILDCVTHIACTVDCVSLAYLDSALSICSILLIWLVTDSIIQPIVFVCLQLAYWPYYDCAISFCQCGYDGIILSPWWIDSLT